ncbi:EndoU domain-containing protein [Streptomyces sp. NBC_01443]|uniref:EndoU domain-containing protein n=1 Tax=Streptomyces sp. NBC_01443 TaxID=2903868 RepID=UPI0022570B30|nr:EndoU domain-containing protein [Streptomyces sp. NBC_01443]MCX4629013.1 EndoU domain-containing protein [Streptomyces sp. NBC_01443]
MSGKSPVDPAEVPVFTGDLAELDKQVKAISSGGATVSTKASDVHTSFGGLQAFYQAPEADQLFATTKPVQDLGLKLSSDMCTIAGALGTYARDAEPLVNRLKTLKREAESFRSRVSDDEKWFEDGDLTDQNLERRNAIAEVWAHFQDVESACYGKIAALVGKPGLKKDDGSHGEGMYGYDAEALKQSKSLPWGDAVEESVPAWQIWEHAWDFGTGFVVDGIGGTLAGLGGLVGLDGLDTFKASWTGLAKLSTATAITSIPGVGPLFFAVPDDKMPSWLRESRTAMKETGKALLAWDQWGSNPSRAAGAVTFNVVTTVCTGGTGGAVSGAGKAGAVAKALSFASKAGRAVDPMTYVFKGAGAGVSKIGDVMAGLKGAGKFETPKINVDGATALPEGTVHLPDGSIHLPAGSAVPDGAIKLPDGNIKLPEGTTTLPPGTVKLPVDGPPQYMDPKYNIYNHKGEITQHAADVPKDTPSAGADVPRVDAPKADSPATAKIPERELAGAVARGGDGIRLGSDISDPLHIPDHAPTGHPDLTPGGRAGDHMPTNNLDNTPHAGHGNGPTTGGGRGTTGGGSHQPGHAGDSGSEGHQSGGAGAGHGGHGSSGGSGHGTGPHDPAGHGSGSGHGGDPHDPAGDGHAPQDPADPGTGQPDTGSGSGHGGDTSTPHQDPPKVEEFPPLPKGGRIPEHTFDHVLQGELKYDRNGNPKVSGYHFRPHGRDLNSHMVKVPRIIEIDHKTGLTTGNVWMRDPRTGEMVMKRAKSTFFPPGWTEKQVRRAMQKSFENGRIVDPATNKWQGKWKGITFEGYFDPITGDAKTIYPLLPKK